MICDSAVICRSVLFGLCVGGTALSVPLPDFLQKKTAKARQGSCISRRSCEKALDLFAGVRYTFMWLVVHNCLGVL